MSFYYKEFEPIFHACHQRVITILFKTSNNLINFFQTLTQTISIRHILKASFSLILCQSIHLIAVI
jgi:hypothetical protein